MTVASITRPLRDEHRELLPHVELLRTTANAVGTEGFERVRRGVEESYEFLVHQLLPHAEAEDEILYPAVARVMGANEATLTMSRDHDAIARLVGELEHLREELASGHPLSGTLKMALRRVLYGLYAVVKLHFSKEEEIYLPLLEERLEPEEAQLLFERMTARERREPH